MNTGFWNTAFRIIILTVFSGVFTGCVDFTPEVKPLVVQNAEKKVEIAPPAPITGSIADLTKQLDELKKKKEECDQKFPGGKIGNYTRAEVDNEITELNRQKAEAQKQIQENLERCPQNILDLFCKGTRDNANQSLENLITQSDKTIQSWNSQLSSINECQAIDGQITMRLNKIEEYKASFLATFPVTRDHCNGGTSFSGKHNGLDVASGQSGELIKASWPGKVVRSQADVGNFDVDGGFGNSIVVEYPCATIPTTDKEQMGLSCPDGQSIFIRYAHMNDKIDYGKPVQPGDTLGHVGSTGNTGHNGNDNVLHMEVRTGQTGSYNCSKKDVCTSKTTSYISIGDGFLDPNKVFPGICSKQ